MIWNILNSNNYSSLFLLLDLEQFVSQVNVDAEITAGDINIEGNILVVGSSKGVIRIYDISDITKFKLLRVQKLCNKEIHFIGFSNDDNLIIVASFSKK